MQALRQLRGRRPLDRQAAPEAHCPDDLSEGHGLRVSHLPTSSRSCREQPVQPPRCPAGFRDRVRALVGAVANAASRCRKPSGASRGTGLDPRPRRCTSSTDCSGPNPDASYQRSADATCVGSWTTADVCWLRQCPVHLLDLHLSLDATCFSTANLRAACFDIDTAQCAIPSAG